MKLRQLEAFKAVVETGTVSQAAELLGISQPAASKLIANFERATGFAVFDRVRGRLSPTPEGLMLYGEVERAFISAKDIARRAEDIRRMKHGRLTLGVMPALATGFIQTVLTEFLSERPAVTVSLQPRSSQQIIESVASQQLDLGITALPIDHPSIETEFLCRVEALCILPAGHQLADQDIVRARDLAGEPLISLSSLDRSLQRIDHAFEEDRVTPDVRIETPMSYSACAFVAQGAGVAVVDPFSALSLGSPSLVLRRFRPVVYFDITLRLPRHRRRSHLTTEFVAQLRRSVHDLPGLPLVEE